MFGARPLLKKAPYKWWPPKQFENFVVGQFDIYPDQFDNKALKALLSSESGRTNPVVDKLQAAGCFGVIQPLSVQEQQTVLSELRELCVSQPNSFKFSKQIPPTAQELEREEIKEPLRPYVLKQACYSLEIGAKDPVPEVLKSTVPYSLETAFAGSHFKSQYKRYRADFYKSGGFTQGLEKIVFRPDKKSKRNVITYFALCIGDSVEIQYSLKEKGIDYTFKRILKSGDCFTIDQSVEELKLGVVRVIPEPRPVGIVLREGALLLQFEKD